jgi:23S rRNA pseudouridine1911/1915/1917 synthase
VDESSKGAKEAILDYQVLETRDELSLVKIRLHTGRSHQIRVQFSNTGHPLYGDQKYGYEISKTGQQIALWSFEIGCKHPTTKQEMIFKCSPPDKKPWNTFSS